MKGIPFIPRKRTIVGALLAVGIAIGVWLSGMLPNLGLGSGDGDESKASVVSTRPISSPVPVPVDERRKTVSSPSVPTDPDVLEVVVNDEIYSIRTVVGETETLEPADLQQIVELAKQAAGNNEGVRVVILRDPSALFLTWKTLEKELAQAGLRSDSIELSRLKDD